MMTNSKRVKYDGETLSQVSETIQGAALSIPELLRKLVLGTIDATGYIHPVAYDENPDIDNPDPMNTFGMDLAEASELQVAAQERAAAELAKRQQGKSKPSTGPSANEGGKDLPGIAVGEDHEGSAA